MELHGLKVKRRKILATILSEGKSVITIDSTSRKLNESRYKVGKLLSSLHRSGWLKMVQPGIYIPVPLESISPDLTDENSFVLASYLFKNCYIGGWSAASFWDFTDQIFQKTWVMTDKYVRKKEVIKSSHSYILRHVPSNYFFGLETKWINQEKIFVSDPHKTIIDFTNFITDFDFQGFLDIFKEYLKSEHKNLDKLIDYAHKAHNRSLFKRIGFLLEKYDKESTYYINICHKNISKGPSLLAPRIKEDSYIKKWRLRVPKNLE